MAYGLAFQNSVWQQVNVCNLTRNDRRYFLLDFISHPEGFHGEMKKFDDFDDGCWILMMKIKMSVSRSDIPRGD